jgi:CRP/FNR family transcriptional regulator, dissimilatory nitrate respiration regulator
MVSPSILKSLDLFHKFTVDELKELAEVCSLRKYSPGEHAFHAGDPANYMYFLIHGTVKVYMLDNKGREIVLHYFNPVCLVGEYANFMQVPFPAHACFETHGEMLLVDFEVFKKEYLSYPHISLRMIASLTTKIKMLEDMVNRGLVLDSTERIAKLIYDNEDIFNHLKHRQIASLLNITPETLSRVIKKLKEDDILDAESKEVKIINLEKLKALVDFNQ